MSTKTTFKRIALVAVAALGLGVLSVAPSSATTQAISVTPSATTSAVKAGETATITLTVAALVDSGESVTVTGQRSRGAAGTFQLAGTSDSTTTTIIGANYSSSLAVESITASGTVPVRAVFNAYFVVPSSAAAGTYSALIYTENTDAATDIVPITWTITVTRDSNKSDGSSTVIIQDGQWVEAITVDEVAIDAKSSTSEAATIKVVQKNSSGSANEAMQVYVTGPGFVKDITADTSTTASTTRVISIAAPGVDTAKYIGVYADGTAGEATVTIVGVDSGLVLGQKKVTFSDTKPASIAVKVGKAYIAAGATTTKVFEVTVKDAAGNAIQDAAASITGSRTDTTTAGKALATADLSCSWDSDDLVYYCSATGASTLKFGPAEYEITATGTDAAETEVSAKASTTYADTVATKVTISAPASAEIGEKITYTLTATEKNGYPIADQSYEGGSANGSTGGIFWNTTTVPAFTNSSAKPFAAGETITTVSGVATVSLYMPVAAGTVAATWVLAGSATSPVGAIDKSIAGTTITVSTAVVNPGVDAATDAANEATDAANAATDAALAAADAADAATAAAQDASDAVAALSASVSKMISNLRAQITSLTNLVIKIQKKVKA